MPLAGAKPEANRRRHAIDIAGNHQLLLAIDIGSSGVRCTAYTIAKRPRAIPGACAHVSRAVVGPAATDADDVIAAIEDVVDITINQLRVLDLGGAVSAVGIASLSMSLVGESCCYVCLALICKHP